LKKKGDFMKNMEVHIRSWLPADLEECRNMWALLTQTHRELYNDQTIGGDDPGRQFDSYLEDTGAENVFLLVGEYGIIGMSGIQISEEEAVLEPLFIKPEYRGMGYSRHLVDFVISKARNAGVKFLSAKPVSRNSRAISVFRSQGFDTVGQIELFMDLKPEAGRKWVKGPNFAGSEFNH
jgi:GNAT superfamily N-acetyltransferase